VLGGLLYSRGLRILGCQLLDRLRSDVPGDVIGVRVSDEREKAGQECQPFLFLLIADVEIKFHKYRMLLLVLLAAVIKRAFPLFFARSIVAGSFSADFFGKVIQ
jgi:hypothetical protein